MEKKIKTNHQTGYHKPVKNPTTNCRPSSHREFCARCHEYNHGCPNTKSIRLDPNCNL